MEGPLVSPAESMAAPQGHITPFRLLVDAVQDYAIFMLSPGGRVASWNVGAEKINGYTADEIVGKHFSTFYPPEAIARDWPAHELAVAREKGAFEEEGWRVRKDGSRFWASVVITAILDKDGTLVGFSKIARDLTERRAQDEALRQSEERFRLLVEGLSDHAIFMLDLDGRVMSWNAAAQKISGYTAQEIIGQHFSKFYPAEAIARRWPEHELTEALREGRFEDEGLRLRKDGSTYCANVVITTLRDAGGQPRGFAKVTRDVSQRKRVETLEYEGRNMSEFLGMFGHELRNPLAPIRNALGVMRRPDADATAVNYSLDVLDRQTRRLTTVVDDLLDVSRVHSGSFALQRAPTPLAGVVARAIEATLPLMNQLRHTVITRIGDYDLVVDADAERLVQMLVKLLDNAARFTPEGGYIELTLGGRRGSAEIRVKDSGAGINLDLLPKVFDLFIHDRSRSRIEGGLGVGLSLVRRIVQLHGGSVEARSEGPGRGAEFVVRLPTIIATAQAQSVPRDDAPVSAHSLRVMIVDDDRDSANSMAMLLRLWGHEAIGVYDGPTALALAREFHPDLLLVDLGLPQMSGYEVARRLRECEGLEEARLVAMTGYGQDADIEHSAQAGFELHLVKPVDESELQRVLAHAPAGDGQSLARVPPGQSSSGFLGH